MHTSTAAIGAACSGTAAGRRCLQMGGTGKLSLGGTGDGEAVEAIMVQLHRKATATDSQWLSSVGSYSVLS